LTAEFLVASMALGEKADRPGLARQGVDPDGFMWCMFLFGSAFPVFGKSARLRARLSPQHDAT